MTIKNITLSADEKLIQLARNKALHEKKSLNILFREWLSRYAGHAEKAKSYKRLMNQLAHVKAGRHFSRDELNER